MGSSLRLTLPGVAEAAGDEAWRLVLDAFTSAERALSRFDADSELSRLNRCAGSSVPVSPLLVRALAAAWRAYRVTRGRFDPRILGALEAAGEHAGVTLPASPARLGPDDAWLALDARRGTAGVSAPVDLGGIGKGLALRWTARRLRRVGHGRFLVTAGGDIVAAGHGPGDRPWVVGLDDPLHHGRLRATLELNDEAVATSSVAVRSWTDADGRRSHHLIDPATLEPAVPVWSSVTVVDRDPAWAEVRSKVAFLAGHGIEAVVGKRRAWSISPTGVLHATEGGSAPAIGLGRSRQVPRPGEVASSA